MSSYKQTVRPSRWISWRISASRRRRRSCFRNIICQTPSSVTSPRPRFFENVRGKRGSRWPHPTRSRRKRAPAKSSAVPKEPIDASRQRMEKRLLQPPERDAMLDAVPGLRAFAISLSGSADRADDLVQETLRRAIANVSSFQAGTNMMAWLFTILRNQFLSEYRKRRREVEDVDGSYIESLTSAPEQNGHLEFNELYVALAKLPLVQREALLLVGASGFSYDQAAAICGTPVGTIKSRVSRARTLLAELLGIDR